MTRRMSNGGFTLIELMSVIVIVAVLTLVAYPAYQSSMIKANRAEAKSWLMHLAQRQQLFFNDTRTYAADLDELIPPPDPPPDPDEPDPRVPKRVADNYVVTFDISTTVLPPTFTIIANPDQVVPATIQKGDGILTISSSGDKTHDGEAW